MDNAGLISKNKSGISNHAVDGLIYGLGAGVVMYLGLLAFTFLSGESPRALSAMFSTSGADSLLQGLISHLAVSAIYGVIFGVLIWPVVRRVLPIKINGWVGGLVYAAFLLLLAQVAILPVSGAPSGILPFWQWALGHGLYGLVLGGLFTRKLK